MLKLPKGMHRRGRVFYVRLQRDGKDVRRSLGTDDEEACRLLRALRREEPPLDAPHCLQPALERLPDLRAFLRWAARELTRAHSFHVQRGVLLVKRLTR
jgi:hypothetical protein